MSWFGILFIVMCAAGFGALLGYLLNSIDKLKNGASLAKCSVHNLYGIYEHLEARVRTLEARNDAENEVKTDDKK